MLLFQQIEDLAYKHTDARRTIGEFLLAKKSRIKEYSMQQIADQTFSSKSSLVRFAKSLGFSGWKEFMEQFLSDSYYEESHYTDIDPNFPFEAGDDTDKIIIQLSNLAVESILDTTDQLDRKELEKAVDILYHSRQIALMAQTPNLYVGELFRRKMATIGKNVLITESDMGLLAHSLSSEDCALLISYSGNSERRLPLKVIPILEEAKVPIIAITGMGENLLRQHATCTLSMSSRERLYTKIGTFATEESINFILNMLYACYFVRDYDRNMEFKTKASRVLEFQRFSQNSDIQEKPQT
ncbi:MAG: MurR/RpiR family transcriptional regulator [Faecalibacterium sp.]